MLHDVRKMGEFYASFQQALVESEPDTFEFFIVKFGLIRENHMIGKNFIVQMEKVLKMALEFRLNRARLCLKERLNRVQRKCAHDKRRLEPS